MISAFVADLLDIMSIWLIIKFGNVRNISVLREKRSTSIRYNGKECFTRKEVPEKVPLISEAIFLEIM